MLRFILLAYLTAFVATTPISAHQGEDAPATGVEIGTLFGLSRFSYGTSVETSYDREEITGKMTLIGVPGGSVGVPWYPSLYISWFPSEQLAIGPEFSFWRMSLEGEYEYEDKYDDHFDDYDRAEVDLSTLYLGVRGAFSPQSNAVSGPYLLGNGALVGLYGEGRFEEDKEAGSEHIFAAGAGLGYQWRVGPAFVVKAEGRYRRWFADFADFAGHLNEFSLTLSLGTRLSGR